MTILSLAQHSTASLEAELNKRRALEETTAKELGHLRAELLRKEEELAEYVT